MRQLTRFQLLEVEENWRNGIHIGTDGAVHKLEDLTPQFLLYLLTEFGGKIDTTIIRDLMMGFVEANKQQRVRRKKDK